MIEMIRVGLTRNVLRASRSPSEIWSRFAHHHPGQRRQIGRANRPDKSPHSITCSNGQKILANPSGIHKRALDFRSFPSAILKTGSDFSHSYDRVQSPERECVAERHINPAFGCVIGGDVEVALWIGC